MSDVVTSGHERAAPPDGERRVAPECERRRRVVAFVDVRPDCSRKRAAEVSPALAGVVGQRIQRCVRQVDRLCRIGTSRFVVWYGTGVDDMELEAAGVRLVRAVGDQAAIGGDALHLHVSVGMGRAPIDVPEIDVAAAIIRSLAPSPGQGHDGASPAVAHQRRGAGGSAVVLTELRQRWPMLHPPIDRPFALEDLTMWSSARGNLTDWVVRQLVVGADGSLRRDKPAREPDLDAAPLLAGPSLDDVPAKEVLARLTSSEQRVLLQMMRGHTAGEIAETLTVSLTTVRAHIRAILRKLEVRTQLAAVAMAFGALEPEPPVAADGDWQETQGRTGTD